jgi:hypothetical protein
MTGDRYWRWKDEECEDLTERGIFTKNAFNNLLKEFRSDTPENIIEIFKKCEIFDRRRRIHFLDVSIIIINIYINGLA